MTKTVLLCMSGRLMYSLVHMCLSLYGGFYCVVLYYCPVCKAKLNIYTTTGKQFIRKSEDLKVMK